MISDDKYFVNGAMCLAYTKGSIAHTYRVSRTHKFAFCMSPEINPGINKKAYS